MEIIIEKENGYNGYVASYEDEGDFKIETKGDTPEDAYNYLVKKLNEFGIPTDDIVVINRYKRMFFDCVTFGRDDLETVGFDGKDIPDNELERFAQKAGEILIENYYWDTIGELASEMGFPELDGFVGSFR